MAKTMNTKTEAGLSNQKVSGELVLIPPGITNLDEKEEKSLLKKLSSEKPLFNAENLTISVEGRVFVTGSLEVCEIVKDYKLEKIDIDTSDGPRNYFRNGITAQGDSLYLACSHFHKREELIFPDFLGDIRKKDQKWSGLLMYGIAHWDLGYQVDSYILHADLINTKNPKFTDEIPLPKKGKCFANGLDRDEKALYVANSFGAFTDQNTFFKVSLTNNGDMIEVIPITFSSPNYDKPNGIKIRGDRLYYTCLQLFQVMTASLKMIKIDNNNGIMGKTDVIYQSPFSFFDDFDIVDNGFVIADIVDIPHNSGSLRFVSKDDRKLRGVFRHKNLIKPSSVKVVKKKTELFDAGDVIIAEKGLHCVSRLRPDEEWRQWLVGSSV